jgi:hypothetical protein
MFYHSDEHHWPTGLEVHLPTIQPKAHPVKIYQITIQSHQITIKSHQKTMNSQFNPIKSSFLLVISPSTGSKA